MKTSISILGAGWLGLPLGGFLSDRGFSVKGSTTRKEKFAVLTKTGIHPFLLEVSESGISGEHIEAFFESEMLLLCIPPGRRRPQVADHYPEQIRLVAKKAREAGVRHLIYISSTGVYGDSEGVVTETSPTDPDRSSARAVWEAEKVLRSFEFSLTVLRMAGLVGGDRKAGRFLAGKKDVKGGGTPVNLVHREDCIQVIWEVIRQEAWGETYNVCADKHPSRRQFYTWRAEKEGFEPPEFADDEGESGKIVSNRKLKEDLNYHFLHPDPMQF